MATTGTVAPSPGGTVEQPGTEWQRLYRIGGVCAWSYVVFALAVPLVITTVGSDVFADLVDAPRLLERIADDAVTWGVLQSLVLMSSILMIVTFVAMLVALQAGDRVLAVIGATVSIATQVLFMAYYPVLLGLSHLGAEYATATAGRQAELATAADALIAINRGFNPVYEAMMAVGILLLVLADRARVFPAWVNRLGIATCLAAFAGLSLYPVLGLSYFAWWAVFAAWFLAVGWRLWSLGRA